MDVQASSMSVKMMAKSISQDTMGAELINKTLNNLNQNKGGSANADMEFQKDVLSAAATGKGTIINIIA